MKESDLRVTKLIQVSQVEAPPIYRVSNIDSAVLNLKQSWPIAAVMGVSIVTTIAFYSQRFRNLGLINLATRVCQEWLAKNSRAVSVLDLSGRSSIAPLFDLA
jgi:hypothetical protein